MSYNISYENSYCTKLREMFTSGVGGRGRGQTAHRPYPQRPGGYRHETVSDTGDIYTARPAQV